VSLAGSTSRRALTSAIEKIRESLVNLMSSIYARIDYPDEDLGDFSDTEVRAALHEARAKAITLSETYRTGRAVSEGISAVIVGKPNVGKSSLYNAILGEDRAIVTSIAGTTRDVLSERIPLGKIMLRLSDTAGIRDKDDADMIESIGIEKSREKLKESELIFAIFDTSRDFDEEDAQLIEEIKKASGTKIAILNKCDLQKKFDEKNLEGIFTEILSISAKESTPAEINSTLASLVNRLFTDEKIIIGDGAVISSARQNASLQRAIEAMDVAINNLDQGFPQDLVSGDIEQALEAISELDGRAVSEEIVADIFSKFCVGK
jgi:tRNA modification GTPase